MNELSPPYDPVTPRSIDRLSTLGTKRHVIRRLNIGNSRIFPAPRRYRRQVRTSYTVVLIMVLLAAYAGIANAAFGGYYSALASAFAVIGFLFSGFLHHRGRHTWARVNLLVIANLTIFVMGYLLAPNSNIALFLLSFVGLPFIVMSWRERRKVVLALCSLPLGLWIILMVTNYGNGAFVEVSPEISAVFGYSQSIMVFAFVAIEFAYYDWVTQNYSRAVRRSLRNEERANKAKTTFLRSMSHEMRTPLNAILGASDLLAHHPRATPDIKRLARIIDDAGSDVLSLTEKSMAYARITAGNFETRADASDPLSLLEPITERFRDKIQRKDIALEISKTNHRKVLVDNIMFTEAMTQIIENAVAYTPDNGKVRLSIEDGASGYVRIMVSDTGPGIPKSRHHQVFRPYERLDQTYGTKSGSGVGLTIAKSYIDAMNGRIGLEDRNSEGSTVGTHIWVEVPVA